MSEWVSRIRAGSGRRRAALGLVVALLLATAVDAALWAVRQGGSGEGGSANSASPGHVASPLLTSAYSNALLVGACHQAAYFIFWITSNDKLQGEISQYLIEPPRWPDQKAPGTDQTGTASPA